VVTSGGGSEKRRRNNGWYESDRSTNAISAEVSTYESVFVAIYHVVDLPAGLGIACLDHPRVVHPGTRLVDRQSAAKGATEELRQRNAEA
jgi:hypothetical protein